ncbi:CRAL-TRIO domain-containing protein [Bombardia bombarda]|uniref:CRAL-TRIO domain-containing protein n=1 Tax=Bombardia bombarda TaxID=252184 RepID=A0AA40CEI1_9PEZI|nr:CRAL-TRIO domain-containing protein [Bombardia bombarda]
MLKPRIVDWTPEDGDVPIAAPTADSHPKEHAPLTAEQQEKYNWLLSQVRAWTDVPSTKGKAGPLTDSEKFWLTRECLLRYLRATKWHQKDSEKRILETLTWRREYGVEELTPEHISPENETGKQIILGFDKEGRVCHYLNPGRQNTAASPRQTLSLLINFKSSKSRSNTAPGIGMAREVLHILQSHYPERLGKALIINVPWIVNGFFKLITPFIDPMTREKLKFNEDMSQYVPKEQLWNEFHGALEFDYDHSVYWPALMKMCKERREARYQRWVAGGQQIGELEDYISGHVQVGVAGAAKVPEEEEKKVEAAPVVAAPEPVVAVQEPIVTAPAPVVAAPEPAASAEVAEIEETVAPVVGDDVKAAEIAAPAAPGTQLDMARAG